MRLAMRLHKASTATSLQRRLTSWDTGRQRLFLILVSLEPVD